MGVVKNLMVRVGADLSGLVSGFNKAGGATGNFRTKAARDITSLKSSLSEMKSAYTSISETAKDIDLTKSVSKQITEANKELGALEKKATDLENKLAFWSELEPAGMQYQTQALRESLAAVDAQTDSLYYKLQRLENVKSLGESVGIDDVTYSSLNKLQMNIASTEDDIRRMEGAAEGAADATKDLGNSAKAAGNKVKTASNRVGDLRKNAKGSALSVSDLTRSLRRVGVVAVGIKLAGAVLGEFRSLVTGYISQNEILQAKVDELKAGFGQALAPAINVATNALSAMMPYILGVSNAIGELITNLFGSGWTAVAEGAVDAAASTKAATAAQKEYNRSLAGFDQITKLSSRNSSNAPGSTITSVDIKLPAWLSDLPTQLREAFSQGDYKGIGAALAEALSGALDQDNETKGSIGSAIAMAIQGGIDVASGFVEELDWDALGTTIRINMEDMVNGIDFNSIPRLLGAAIGGTLKGGWSIIAGAIEDNILDAAGESGWDIAWSVIAGIGEIIGEFQGWASLKTPIREAISAAFGVDGIREIITEKLVEAVSALPSAAELWSTFCENLTYTLEKSQGDMTVVGGYVLAGILNGIIGVIANLGAWFKDNIFVPFVEEFKNVFDIHSPSKNEEIVSLGSNIIGGILNGAVLALTDIGTWVQTNVFTPISDALAETFKDGFSLQGLLDMTGSVASVRVELLKSGWESLSSFVGSTLSIETSLRKGWTGSVAKALGIESITSKLSLKLPKISINWGSVSVFGKAFSYPTGFNIKWNAKGAILNGAQLFGRVGNTWLGGGEAGREALLPLDRNTGWMDKIADRVAARVSVGGSGEQNLVIYLTLDGKVVTKTVVRNINAQAKATGKNPLAAYI